MLVIVHLLKMLATRLKGRSPVIFDVGSNDGDYAKNILRIFHQPYTIHVFEPSKYTYGLLKQNLENQNC